MDYPVGFRLDCGSQNGMSQMHQDLGEPPLKFGLHEGNPGASLVFPNNVNHVAKVVGNDGFRHSWKCVCGAEWTSPVAKDWSSRLPSGTTAGRAEIGS